MRIPLLSGSSVVVVDAPDDAVVLRPPPPGEALDDVRAAIRDALRFPLAGEPLAALAPRGGRATIVIEPPALPLPGAQNDPRQAAIAAASTELARLGIPAERQTLLVATGLMRRPDRHDLEGMHVVSPEFARSFHGRVVIHDAEDTELVDLGEVGNVLLRVNRALLETDVVLTVSAAESVLHGGPALLLAAGAPAALRAAGTYSLLETGASQGWRLAVELERLLSQRTALIGASLVLNQPRLLAGGARGFPYEEEALERIARSPLRRGLALLPGFARDRVMKSLRWELGAAAAYAGRPSVAHAEALLRAVESRSAPLEGRLDAICIGIPRTTPHLPRERPNPLLAAYLGLGLALRLWRDHFPVAEGGTLILLNRFHRHFAHPTQQPYRAIFQAARFGRKPDELAEGERLAATDSRAIAAYREGRTCHPLLPFADWSGCQPALGGLGSVLVAGCRDAVAARQLGFVPARGLGAALEMARGRAGENARIGFLVSPPFFPLRVEA